MHAPTLPTDPPAPAKPTLHARLRDGTAAAHARLEAALALLQPPLSQARFAATLAGLHGFHRSWEPALAATLADPAFSEPRRGLSAIEHDLRSLGTAADRLDTLPRCPDAAALCSDVDTALGSLYVIEGSTLGGAVIGRHLDAAPWLPAGGLRYFGRHGDRVAPMWRETLAYIERRCSRPAVVVGAAAATFALLQRWLAPGAETPA